MDLSELDELRARVASSRPRSTRASSSSRPRACLPSGFTCPSTTRSSCFATPHAPPRTNLHTLAEESCRTARRHTRSPSPWLGSSAGAPQGTRACGGAPRAGDGRTRSGRSGSRRRRAATGRPSAVRGRAARAPSAESRRAGRRRSRRAPRRTPPPRETGRRPALARRYISPVSQGSSPASPPPAATRVGRGSDPSRGRGTRPASALGRSRCVKRSSVPSPSGTSSISIVRRPRRHRVRAVAARLPAPGVDEPPRRIDLDELAARACARGSRRSGRSPPGRGSNEAAHAPSNASPSRGRRGTPTPSPGSRRSRSRARPSLLSRAFHASPAPLVLPRA